MSNRISVWKDLLWFSKGIYNSCSIFIHSIAKKHDMKLWCWNGFKCRIRIDAINYGRSEYQMLNVSKLKRCWKFKTIVKMLIDLYKNTNIKPVTVCQCFRTSNSWRNYMFILICVCWRSKHLLATKMISNPKKGLLKRNGK